MSVEKEVYIQLTDLLGIPQNNLKNCQEIIVIVFEIEIDTPRFIAWVPIDKLDKGAKATAKVHNKKAIRFLDIQLLIEFFSFCLQAIKLDQIYMKRL